MYLQPMKIQTYFSVFFWHSSTYFSLKYQKKKEILVAKPEVLSFYYEKKMESISRTCVTFTLLTNLIIIITNSGCYPYSCLRRKKGENYLARVLCMSSSFWLLSYEGK